MPAWKDRFDARPPLDNMRRNESLWLFDGYDVFPGSFVEFSEGEAMESESYFAEDGTPVEITHFRERIRGEEAPDPPVE